MVTFIGVRTHFGSTAELFSALSRISKERSLFLQAFNPDSIVSRRHIEHAYELSRRAFAGKRNIARTREAELLLRAAGTPKIDKAIERVGVKDASKIILFSPSRIPKAAIAELGVEDRLLLGLGDEKKRRISRLFGVEPGEPYPLEELVLEKLALLE